MKICTLRQTKTVIKYSTQANYHLMFYSLASLHWQNVELHNARVTQNVE